MNQLQAVAMNEGYRWKKKLFSEKGRALLEEPSLAPWASPPTGLLPVATSINVSLFADWVGPASRMTLVTSTMFFGRVPWRTRILSDEFQQRRISKAVPALENDVLMHKIRMLMQVCTQTSYVTFIENIHGTAKCCIFNAL